MTQQTYQAQSMSTWPSSAQPDGTEPEFEIQRARRVMVVREQARLIMVPPRQVTGDWHHGQACQDDTSTRK